MNRVPVSTAERRDRQSAIIASAPAVITIDILFAYPMLYAVALSSYRVGDKTPASNGITGVRNYLPLLSDSRFQSSLLRTSIFCMFTVFEGMGPAIGIVGLLNRKFRGRTVARVLLLIPWAVPPVVNGIIWKVVFDDSYGAISYVLMGPGITGDRIQWLAIPNLAVGALILVEIWKLIPLLALMALTSIRAIPTDMYHAAIIDDADSWQQFWRILLPNMRGTVMFLFTAQLIWSIKVFDFIYVLTDGSGGPAEATTTVNFLTCLTTSSYLDRGYGTAMPLAIMAIVTLMVMFWALALDRKSKE